MRKSRAQPYQQAYEDLLVKLPGFAIAAACLIRAKKMGLSVAEIAVEHLANWITFEPLALNASSAAHSLTAEQITAIEFALSAVDDDDIKQGIRISLSAARVAQREMREQATIEYSSLLELKHKGIAKRLARDRDSFLSRLGKDWGRPLKTFELLSWVCEEIGSNANLSARQAGMASRRKLIETISRLHARACQTAREIHCLLLNGFASGAMARWRTLHELAVVSAFIVNYGRRASMLFVEHQAVCAKRKADAYNASSEILGAPPISPREYRRIERRYHSVVKKYGRVFEGEFGWADVTLRQSKDRMNLAKMEKLVRQAHMRGNFSDANDSIHATVIGVYSRLGLHETQDDILLSGPSNLGISEVGELVAESLLLATESASYLYRSIDGSALLEVAAVLAIRYADECRRAEGLVLKRGGAVARVFRDDSEE